MSADPREAIALFRYAVISAATNPRLTPAERGHLVRELATQAHAHPDGSQWTYSRVTLDRWIRAYASKVWTDCVRHHAPISARCVGTRSCWRKLANCEWNCRLALPLRLPRFSKREMASICQSAPSASICADAVCTAPP
jgi:hypothetical protein